MELSDAVEKASEGMSAPPLGLTGSSTGGVEFVPAPSMGSYDYLAEVHAMTKKWGGIVGEKILAEAEERKRVNNDDTTREDDDAWVERCDGVFRSTGADVCVGVFALGYLLGDPDYDRLPHDDSTFRKALKEDRETHRLLVSRFNGETFLRDRFFEHISIGATIISMAYQHTDLPRNEENIRSWGRLSASFGVYDAFRIGLATRRVMEEALTFDEFAKDLEG